MCDLHYALPRPLEKLAATQSPDKQGPKPHDDRQWTKPPTNIRGHALAQVDVYLDYFISTCQGSPTER